MYNVITFNNEISWISFILHENPFYLQHLTRVNIKHLHHQYIFIVQILAA
jgi:hypothetical protein